MLQPSTGVDRVDSTSAQAFGLALTDDGLDDAVDSISARVFGLTLTDDGLDNASQTSKLLSSREEFQWRASGHSPSRISVPSIYDVTTSLARLTHRHASQRSQTPEVFHPSSMPFESPNMSQAPTSSSPTSATPYCPTARDRLHGVSNGKHDRRTATAHKCLNAIEARIETMSILVATSTSTPSLQNIREDTLALKEALDGVTRREPSVHDHKQTLIATVEVLLSTIAAREAQTSNSPKQAIKFNCGMYTLHLSQATANVDACRSPLSPPH